MAAGPSGRGVTAYVHCVNLSKVALMTTSAAGSATVTAELIVSLGERIQLMETWNCVGFELSVGGNQVNAKECEVGLEQVCL